MTRVARTRPPLPDDDHGPHLHRVDAHTVRRMGGCVMTSALAPGATLHDGSGPLNGPHSHYNLHVIPLLPYDDVTADRWQREERLTSRRLERLADDVVTAGHAHHLNRRYGPHPALPPGSAAWWTWARDLIATAHNTRTIAVERRNRLLDTAYDVWMRRGGRTRRGVDGTRSILW